MSGLFYWTGYVIWYILLVLAALTTIAALCCAIMYFWNKKLKHLPFYSHITYMVVAKRYNVEDMVQGFKDKDGKVWKIVPKDSHNHSEAQG